MLDKEHIMAIEKALARGNTAEVKKNKSGIIILEVKKEITCGK